MKTMPTSIKPRRIGHEELATVAAEGVARALAARETCLRELSEQEIADVSGGALFLKGIIAGGIREALASKGLGFATLNQGVAMPGLEAGMGSAFNVMG